VPPAKKATAKSKATGYLVVKRIVYGPKGVPGSDPACTVLEEGETVSGDGIPSLEHLVAKGALVPTDTPPAPTPAPATVEED
jgi:hypothetical protein